MLGPPDSADGQSSDYQSDYQSGANRSKPIVGHDNAWFDAPYAEFDRFQARKVHVSGIWGAYCLERATKADR
jgi:hypothetical protein